MNKIGKIVILGGSGFIGAQSATKLSPVSENIIIPTRDMESNSDPVSYTHLTLPTKA